MADDSYIQFRDLLANTLVYRLVIIVIKCFFIKFLLYKSLEVYLQFIRWLSPPFLNWKLFEENNVSENDLYDHDFNKYNILKNKSS